MEASTWSQYSFFPRGAAGRDSGGCRESPCEIPHPLSRSDLAPPNHTTDRGGSFPECEVLVRPGPE